MKTAFKISVLSVIFFSFLMPSLCHAQIPSLRREAKRAHSIGHDIAKEKLEDAGKEKGREEARKGLEKATYENDDRYPTPENRVQATIGMEMKSFKNNGKVKDVNHMKLVFGPTGECMIMNENTTNETHMLFDYEGAANYMVNVEQKTALKMPMINFQKIAEKMAEKGVDIEDESGTWEKTNEHKTIHGYHCRKYIYTDEENNRMLMWFSKDISIDLSDNHFFGGQIKDFSSDKTFQKNLNAPSGLMVRSLFYEKGDDKPSTQMDIVTFEKSYDPAYFDLSKYEVNDILGRI